MTAPQLSLLDRRHLVEALSAVGRSATAVVLVGSRARGVGDASSDIDLLVVSSGPTPRVRGRVQIIQVSEEELERRLKMGDDFPAWVIRYGKPIQGLSRWRALRDRLSTIQPWPDARIKWTKARTHVEAAGSLLYLGDRDAALEEAKIGLSHLARALLLERGVFPLSRPELAEQLDAIGETDLAGAMTSVDGDVDVLVRKLLSRIHG
jgi:predicted nucleotidyltransferase